MESQLRQTNPDLANRWIEDTLEVSKHRREVEKEMLEVIKHGRKEDFILEIFNSSVSFLSLLAILGAVIYTAIIGQKEVAIAIFASASLIVTVLRLGKNYKQGKDRYNTESSPSKGGKKTLKQGGQGKYK